MENTSSFKKELFLVFLVFLSLVVYILGLYLLAIQYKVLGGIVLVIAYLLWVTMYIGQVKKV